MFYRRPEKKYLLTSGLTVLSFEHLFCMKLKSKFKLNGELSFLIKAHSFSLQYATLFINILKIID